MAWEKTSKERGERREERGERREERGERREERGERREERGEHQTIKKVILLFTILLRFQKNLKHIISQKTNKF